eukprot:TRINITY_DN332_c0_g1_i1.p1 TRINITY_DN332_c0_g1~~TRINITY_DN332_c0_g1_i1.p1  ORF type:complete len:401 (-),score=74.31 TRINITY_DN332_c0_g1_i1:228-1430(-)
MLRKEIVAIALVVAFVAPFCAAISDASPRAINGSRVVYGTDNRKEHSEQSVALKNVGDATVVLMKSNMLSCNANTCSALGWSRLTAMDICSTERFSNQYIPGFCSGFLISSNQIATAGHCIRTSSDCSSVRFVFDFIAPVGGDGTTSFPANNVYRCSSFKSILDGDVDFAVVTLDRQVTSRTPLQLASTPATTTSIYVVGHPSGLPRKYADSATVRSYPTATPSSAWYFTADLDTFAGNSGSAVLASSNNDVVGILVRGAPDYVQFVGETCLRVNVCPIQSPVSDRCFGEDVTLSRTIQPFVPNTCTSNADCNSQGQCNLATGKCTCNSGFYGNDCSFNCAENICQNGGKCVGLWECDCASGYGSDLCYKSSASSPTPSAKTATAVSIMFAVVFAVLLNA